MNTLVIRPRFSYFKDPVLCAEKSMQESLKDTLHDSLKTARLFINLASTNVDVQGMQYENVNIIEDIPLFIAKDYEPENILHIKVLNLSKAVAKSWTKMFCRNWRTSIFRA